MEHPLRYYKLLDELDELYESMDTKELLPSSHILQYILSYFEKMYFENHIEIDSKCLVKTLDDAYTNLLETYLHKQIIEDNKKMLEDVD